MAIESYSRKELREAVKEIKAELVDKEKSNTGIMYFYLSPSGGNWFVAGGNSALMFMNLYAKRVGYSGEIRKDSDTFAKFDLGTIRLPNFDTSYAPRLRELGLKQIKPQKAKNADFVRIFKLPQKLSSLELTRWRNIAETERARTNSYLEGQFKQPLLFTEIRVEMRFIIDFAYKMPAPMRAIHGIKAGQLAFDLYMGWMQMAKGEAETRVYLEKVMTDTSWLLSWLHFLLDSHDAQQKFISNRAEGLLKIREQVECELKRMNKEQANG